MSPAKNHFQQNKHANRLWGTTMKNKIQQWVRLMAAKMKLKVILFLRLSKVQPLLEKIQLNFCQLRLNIRATTKKSKRTILPSNQTNLIYTKKMIMETHKKCLHLFKNHKNLACLKLVHSKFSILNHKVLNSQKTNAKSKILKIIILNTTKCQIWIE